ncbi:mitochondrial biogenesis AIM24-domain-containing protein [Elsinoe ampelina]|uniref:Altered inheritance of mitochondria protein 24, mitochondrial n=1 Tax=Elsinoe ampelina TaxID=302913 RepID=A0A6A6GQ35_9PEZI|nr:mitochondrial biogenesis AIM24-domain-containing protein [Elsinoe ampelina]
MRSRVLGVPAPLRPHGVSRQFFARQIRTIQINSTPASSTPSSANINIPDPSSSQDTPDAQFEVLGGPSSLLSASVSASQTIYTRRGSLVGFNGKAENAVSTLSLLEPFRRAAGGIPFLYQKITSTTPFTALIATKSQLATFTVVHLDGRLDWMIAQRNALLAWTGHTLSLKPQINTKMSVAHWGNTRVTGRGLICLSGKGQIYQVMVRSGEEYVVHPGNVVAYSIMKNAPQPYRFKSSSLRFQIPNPTTLLPDTRFLRTIRESQIWRFLSAFAFTVRTWTRRSIFGDRLFLRFEGPANILLQARGNSISESLTNRDVNEIADAPAGAVLQTKYARTASDEAAEKASEPKPVPVRPTRTSYASVGGDGKVAFERSS